jgi:hypothetical protein
MCLVLKPMKKSVLILCVFVTVYAAFTLTIGVVITRRVGEFGVAIGNAAPTLPAESMPVNSSVCPLLAERDNWRGRLQAASFPMAARAADRLLERYSFRVDSNSGGPTHCGKFGNRVLATARH